MAQERDGFELPEPEGWRWAAASVHVFTAIGIICALFAIHAVLDRAYETAFVWLGIALIIDGVDGAFARALEVKRRLPRFSGEQLDLVVDYVTYVFVPTLALQLSGYLTGVWGGVLAGLICSRRCSISAISAARPTTTASSVFRRSGISSRFISLRLPCRR